MFRKSFALLLAACSALFVLVANASAASLWTDVDEANVIARGPRLIQPEVGRTLRLNFQGMTELLRGAPREAEVSAHDSSFDLALPLPEGGFGRFSMVETQIMEPALAERYPTLKAYVGQGIDNPTTTVRIDLTARGFRAQLIANTHTSYIEPFQKGDLETYIAFNKSDYAPAREPMRCGVTGDMVKSVPNLLRRNSVAALASGANLRTYRLALATTGEYTAAVGGTVIDALSSVVTTINRVNGIYERELSVRMVLVANNDLLIYTNPATDPYLNNDGFLMLDQNQANVTALIGSANYDIGHVFSTGGGGVASLGSVCAAGRKAAGVTGLGNPTGDSYDVDYVAHEMGHQFAGEHTFNGSGGSCTGGNRNGDTAYEPGSGITIQAYAGICGGDNLQNASEDYFHRVSLDQMLGFIANPAGGASCGVSSVTGNTPPTVTTASGYTIPRLTPFTLTAVGSDANNDPLTYVWEQFDLGAANPTGVLTDAGSGPLFRSFAPSADPSRTFPSLRYILNNANVAPATAPLPGTTSPNFMTGEVLPSTARTMNFRVTVRDNRAGGGGTNDAATAITVAAGAGPFAVTAPNTAVSWTAGTSQTVSWNVANTNLSPVSTANVQIALSLDGGNSFPTILLASTPNTGSATVNILANTPSTTQARIRVAAVNNIYFDISDVNFTITDNVNAAPTLNVTGSVSTSQGAPSATAVVATTNSGSNTVSVSQVPSELTVTAANAGGNISLTATAACTLVTPTSGSKAYPVLLTVTSPSGATSSLPVNVLVGSNVAPSLGLYGDVVVARGSSATVVPASPLSDLNNNLTTRAVNPTLLPGSGVGAVLTIAASGTITVNTDANTTPGTYTVRAVALDVCNAVRTREFKVTVIPPGPFLQFASNQLPTGNGLIERGECNSVNVSLRNLGSAAATGVNATLWSSTPGVLVTQPNAVLPDIATAQTQTTAAPFQVSTASGFVCGADATFTVVANHGGGNSPGVFSFSLPTGTTSTLLNETFATVVAPALPAGWTSVRTGAAPPALWASAAAAPQTAFTNGVAAVATNSLITPAIALPASSGGATVSVRHTWNFEATYDGGVLEVSTDGGTTFNDITSPAVGGVFVANGYDFAISSGDGNPIAGRMAWTGEPGVYVTSTARLPVALNGQTIQLRFRAAWDTAAVNPGANWRIDTVTVNSGGLCPSVGVGACVAPALLNVDDSGSPDIYASATDGLLLLRYLLGMRDAALTDNVNATAPQRNATQIATHINSNLLRFDVDGDREVRATTDGLLILRRLLGLSGNPLTAGVRVGNRTNIEIENAIDALRP